MLDYTGKFREGTNYKLTFAKEVDRLLAVKMVLPERIKAVEVLLEAYVRQVGEVPDPVQVNRLTDFILREDLKDKNHNKVAETEFPFLSGRQIKFRGRREISCNVAGAKEDMKLKPKGKKVVFRCLIRNASEKLIPEASLILEKFINRDKLPVHSL